VNTAVFLEPEYAFISAVLHSMVDCINRPDELGGDFQVLHNPIANRPLDPTVFSWCDQFIYENGTLMRTGDNTRWARWLTAPPSATLLDRSCRRNVGMAAVSAKHDAATSLVRF